MKFHPGWIGVGLALATAAGAQEPAAWEAEPTRGAAPEQDIRRVELARLPDGAALLRVRCAAAPDPARMRILLDRDGPEKGAPPAGWDALLEGETQYAPAPGAAVAGAWDEAGAALVARADDGLVWFLPLGDAARARLLVETTDENWRTVDRFPAADALAFDHDRLPEWAAPPVPGLAVRAEELNAARPSTLTERFRRDTKEFDGRETAAGGALGDWRPHPDGPALPLRLELRDAVTGAVAPAVPARRMEARGVTRWSGAALDVEWTLELDARMPGRARLSGELSATNERAVSVSLGVRPGGAGREQRWWDDLTRGRPPVAAGGPYENSRPFPFGAARRQSLHPFAGLDTPAGALFGMIEPREPRAFRWRAEPDGDFFGVTFELGLTPHTLNFPGRAAFAAVLAWERAPAADAFRLAARAWHAEHPLRPGALTLPAAAWAPPEVPAARRADPDFAFGFRGADGAPLDWAPSSPWRWRAGRVAEERQAPEEALARARFFAATDRTFYGLQALTAALGGARRRDGAAAMERIGEEFFWPLSADPELLTTPSYPLNRALLEWNDLASARDGVALVSPASLRVLDANRTALAAADYPAVFDRDGVVGLATPLAAYEFCGPMAGALQARNKRLLLRGAPERLPWLTALADAVVEETDEPPPGDPARWAARRATAGPRQVSLVWRAAEPPTPDELEKMLRAGLYWGVVPSVTGGDYWTSAAPERDRALYRTWLPLIRRVADARWQPVGVARAVTPEVGVETWGDGESGPRLLTVHNRGDRPADVRLPLTPEAGAAVALLPLTADVVPLAAGADAALRLRLAADETALVALLPPDQLAAEDAWLATWNAGRGEAAAARENLADRARAEEAGVTVALDYPHPALRGESNPLTVRLTNRQAAPLVISGLRLRHAGRTRVLLADAVTLGAGETRSWPGEFAAGEESDDPWARLTWSAERGQRRWEMQRVFRPRYEDALSARAPATRVAAAGREALLSLIVRNASARPRELTLVWDGDFSSGEEPQTVAPQSVRTFTLKLEGRRGKSGLARVSVRAGTNTIFTQAIPVEFLSEGASLARDTAARLTVSSAGAGVAAALTDGQTPENAGGAAVAAWASEDTALPHRVRLDFAAPTVTWSVKLHWPARDGVPQTGRKGILRGWLEAGREIKLAEFSAEKPEPVTTLTYDPVALTAVEWEQPAGGGARAAPDTLALTEFEVR